MAIPTTDIDVHGSGGSGETDPNNWLGGVRSNTELNPVVSEENLFANVAGQEANDGSVKHRGIYFRNANGSLTLDLTVIWFTTQTPSSDTSVAMALAGEGLNATIEIIADEDTPPVGETFTAPATKAAGLSMGSVPNTQHFGFWIERTVIATASAFNDDDWAFRIEGDTPQ